ncbi:MAG: outer membrane lipoprotein carrier protein LolA, partial [Candidatus Binatia bacterium]
RSLKAWGKLTFKRPGKMLWRYEEPKGQFVLADGKNLYFYQPEQNQVIKSPLKNAFRSDIPLSFLLGIGDLKRDFNATLKGIEENQYVLLLEPRGESGGFSEVLVGVSRTTSDLLWVSVRDAVNNLTTIRLSGMRKGVGVQESLFQFEIPEGADLVELGQ